MKMLTRNPSFLQSPIGRVVVHLFVYGIAAGVVAVVTQLQGYDYGAYTTIATLALGMVADYARKAMQP